MKNLIGKYNGWLYSFTRGQSLFIGIVLALLSVIMLTNGASMLLVLPLTYVAGNFVGRSTMGK